MSSTHASVLFSRSAFRFTATDICLKQKIRLSCGIEPKRLQMGSR
jgi:hypothetical protein